jgi:hypothetical protein
MNYAWRCFAARMWSVHLFRWFCVVWVVRGLPFANWLAVNTPLLVSLRELAIQQGDYPQAIKITNALWEANEL